jgi:anti-anti-sigma factor
MPEAAAVASPSPPLSAAPFVCELTAGGSRAAWIHLGGELDLLTSPKLKSVLQEAQLHARLVVLDAREVTFIDSTGIHVILDASNLSEWGGARLMLIPSAPVEMMLTALELREQVSLFDLASNEPAPALRLL